MEAFKSFVLLLGLLLAVAAAQANYRFITWNTNGARWSEVANFLDQYHVLGIQEAGVMPRVFGRVQEIPASISTVDEDAQGRPVLSDFDGGVKAYSFVYGNVQYYMYYYDHPVDDAWANQQNRDTRKQNLAIITPERAGHVYVIPPHSLSNNRVDVNRPTIGLSLSGYTVFTAHTDPNPSTNEVNETIEKVARFMAASNQCQQKRWILMGDFNAPPTNIRLPSTVPFGCFVDRVYPAQITKPLRSNPNGGSIIDFGVYGGPANWQGAIQAQTQTQQGLRGSDHYPVVIGPVGNAG